MVELPHPAAATARRPVGPDLAIVGAARSGTSSLAARLAAHPLIDAGSVKEPNFFSRHLGRGEGWYESLFSAPTPDRRRMDASVSYTFPHFPQALRELAAAAPGATVVYLVRDPVRRAVSHYNFYRYYFELEAARDFGTALRANPIYLGTSDYAHWLEQIMANFPVEQVLVVPFAVATTDVEAVASVVYERLGLDPRSSGAHSSQAHRNHVVAFRSQALRRVSSPLRRSRLYPLVRGRLGADRLRRLRAAVTREIPLPSVEESLGSCSSEQDEQLSALSTRAQRAVTQHLAEQDARTGLDWSAAWVGERRS